MQTKISIKQLQDSVIARFNNTLTISATDNDIITLNDILTAEGKVPTVDQVKDTNIIGILEEGKLIGLALVKSITDNGSAIEIVKTIFAEQTESEEVQAGSMQVMFEGELDTDIINISDLLTACGNTVTWDLMDNTCIIHLVEDDIVVGLAYITAVNKSEETIEVTRSYYIGQSEYEFALSEIEKKQDILTAGDNVKIESNVVSVDFTGLVTQEILDEEVDTIVASLTKIMTLKGIVASTSDLPLEDNKLGDVYLSSADSTGYVWISEDSTGTADSWKSIGGTMSVSLENYYTKTYIDDELTAIQQSVLNNASAISKIVSEDLVKVDEEIDAIDTQLKSLQDEDDKMIEDLESLEEELSALKLLVISPYRDVIYDSATTFIAELHKDYFFNTIDSLNITFPVVTDTDKEARIKVGFISGETATVLSLPNGTIIPNDFMIYSNTVYLLEFYYKSGVWYVIEDVNSKQNKLVAGDNITISGNVISATVSSTGTAGIEDAPNDGKDYIRNSEQWVELTSEEFKDAPSDDKEYVRINGQWVENTDETGITDVDDDGNTYVRKYGEWVKSDAVSGGTTESYTLPTATSELLGGIKVGSSLTINDNGELNVAPVEGEETGGTTESYTLPIATSEVLGGIKIGTGFETSEDGTVNAIPVEAVIPVATKETLGAVIVGDNIDVAENGEISVTFPTTITQAEVENLISNSSSEGLSEYSTTESMKEYITEELGKLVIPDEYNDESIKADLEKAIEDMATLETTVSGLSNYDDTDIKKSISDIETDLDDVYTKSETYTQDEVDEMVSALVGFTSKMVGEDYDLKELPAVEDAEERVWYFVKEEGDGTNTSYAQWIVSNGTWHYLGSTQIDLSNVYLKSETYSQKEIDEKTAYATQTTKGTIRIWKETVDDSNILYIATED